MQKGVQEYAREAVEDQGVSGVRASANGRLVKLRGILPTQSARDSLRNQVSLARGVRYVVNETMVGQREATELITDGKKLRIRGSVPDYRTREILTSYAKEIYGRSNVNDQTIIDSREIDLRWPNMVRTLIEAVKDLDDARVVLVDNSITITLDTDNPSAFSGKLEKLYSSLEPGFVLQSVQYASSTELSREACSTELAGINEIAAIQFQSGTSEFGSGANAVLMQVVNILNRCPKYPVTITGHTDASGSEASNVRLSVERARSVANEMIALGVEDDRIEYLGKGSSEPIADNNTEEGKAANRRIEFELGVTTE